MRASTFTIRVAVVLSLVGALAHAQQPKAGAQPGAKPGPAVTSAPPPTTAPPPPPPAPPTLAQTLTGDAKLDYESGKLLLGDGDFAGALVKFGSAYDKAKDPRLLWNMAACEKGLRHYAKALKLLRAYAKSDATSPEDRTEANDLIKVMEPFTSKLRINVSEAGADVLVDQDPAGKTPLEPVVVDIGTRRIRVTKEGFQEFAREVPVGGSAESTVEVKLLKIVHEGKVIVRAGPSDTITFDGQVVGIGSWVGTVPSGGHTLRVTASKMQPYQTEVLVQDNQTRDVPVTLVAEPTKGLPLWAWIAGGVAVAGLGVGGYFVFRPSPTYEGPVGTLGQGTVEAAGPRF